MDCFTFEIIEGTHLYRYLENNDILNFYPSLKKIIGKAFIFRKSYYSMRGSGFAHSSYDAIKLKWSMKNESLVTLYNLIYHHNLSFIVHEILNIIIENDNLSELEAEYIILFLLAVQYNDYTSIDMIISNGFDINKGNKKERTTGENFISTAYIINNNKDMIHYLLSKEEDINNEHCHILKHACSRGDVDIINYLFNFDINDDKLFTMFITSIMNKHFTIADKIINYGFKIEDKYQEILDCYYYATSESIEYLIQHLDINKHGSQILSHACRTNKYQLIDSCLQYNLTVDKEILKMDFSSFCLNTIKVFAKNYIDLSTLKVENTEYDSLIISLKNNGLDMILFAKYLLKQVDKVD